MKMKRLVSIAMALLLMASLPVTAFAEEYDLAIGEITVEAKADGRYVTQTNNAATDGGYKQTTATVITQTDSNTTTTTNTVTIKADAEQTANVTLSGVNIDSGSAAVSTSGEGSVIIELDGTNTVRSGNKHAGLEKNNDGSLTITDADNDGSLTAQGGTCGAGIGGSLKSSGSNITITGGEIKANGGEWAAGIGGGYLGSGSNITISGGKVTAQGGRGGAGIGGGMDGKGSDITVSGDAKVKVQGNVFESSVGAAIGGGGGMKGFTDRRGADLTPDTSKLTPEGKIEYYDPGVDMSTAQPIEDNTIVGTYVPETEPEPESKPEPDEITTDTQAAPLYRVTDKDSRGVNYKAERKDGVLTVTADADFAVLTGTLYGVSTLKAQGVKKIVFVTKSAKSTFALADLLEKGSTGETYQLTHDSKTVTFTLGVNKADVSDVLEKA